MKKMKFVLDEKETKKAMDFIKKQDKIVMKKQNKKIPWQKTPYYGMIGEGYTYTITPTGLGNTIVITNNKTKEKLNVTNFDDW
jgi:hypothetical protein